MNTLILIAGAAALVASPAVAAPHSHLGKPMAHKASKARSANTRTAAARGKAYAWGMDRQMGEIVERDAARQPARQRLPHAGKAALTWLVRVGVHGSTDQPSFRSSL